MQRLRQIWVYLHNDGSLFLIPGSEDVCGDVHTYSATYDFKPVRDWWGVNVKKLCYGIDASAIISLTSNAQQFQYISFWYVHLV